jgi:hypothetical protein
MYSAPKGKVNHIMSQDKQNRKKSIYKGVHGVRKERNINKQ